MVRATVRETRSILVAALLALGLAWWSATPHFNYLLFHSLAEMFSVVVAAGIFMVVWHSRRLPINGYLRFVGTGFVFVGFLDLLHTLAYSGMGVFQPAEDANLPTQLWVAARYLQAITLCLAPLFLRRNPHVGTAALLYAGVTALLVISIFHWRNFPDCLLEGTGLTPFKRISEYFVCALLLLAAVLLGHKRRQFDAGVARLLIAAIAVSIISELAFTLYADPHGPINGLGHYFKIVAFYLIYRAVIETGLERPYDLLFRDLQAGQQRLAESEERYRSLVELSPRCVAVHIDGKFVYINPVGAELFGADKPEELIGRMVLDLIHSDDREMMTQRMRDLHEGALAVSVKEARIVRLDGAPVPVESVGARITYDGRLAIQLIMTDITERRRAEQQLRQARQLAEAASRAKDEFLAVLSHELRTPLTPVLALTTALQDDLHLPENLRGDIAMIRRNVELQARLIDDLLDLTRIERGKVELAMRPVDLHAEIDHVLRIVHGDIDARELKLSVALTAGEYWVSGDSARLQQALWNLLKNAVKFSRPGGRLTVRSWNEPPIDGGRPIVCVSVEDTGIGIESEALGRVFHAFEQGGRQVTRQFGGLGLGLTIARAMIERHGGRIEAFSRGRDQGATFTIRLTSVPAPQTGDDPLPADNGGSKPLHILLVEDHADTAYLMSRLLRRLHHSVQSAGSMHAALEAARTQPFDLVISDLGLPDGSGLDLMRQLRARHGLKGICLSGYGMDHDLQRSREAGFERHLVKPVDFQLLRGAIEQLAR